MKRLVLFAVLGIFVFSPTNSEAQILKKLKKKVEKKIEKKVDEEIDDAMSKKEKDKEVKKIDTIQGDEKDKKEDAGIKENSKQPDENEKLSLNWSKYDFVPGDKVIFEDNLFNEENGEFPARWDLGNGTAEIAEFGGENVIMFRGNATWIVPYLKNPEKDYLPDVFTIEFDLYKPSGSFDVYLYDRKNQKVKSNATRFVMWSNGMECHSAKSTLPGNKKIDSKWVHIAIAYTKGKLKGYIDDTRLINIPHLEFNPMGLTLYCYHASDNNRVYVKNIRIAEGGVKFYDRMMQDGKIIANGIRFDVNKATLRPESMGIINSIYELMSEHPEIKFSIEGHTDSDGNNDFNQKLSEDRADAVLRQLVSMGINKERLTSKGFGESKPIDSNNSEEGKANNRRVEFVKI